MAVEKGPKQRWSGYFSLCPFPSWKGVFSQNGPQRSKGAPVLRGEANPSRRGPFLRSSTRGKGAALNGPLKWPSRSPPLTHGFEAKQPPPQHQSLTPVTGVPLSRNRLPDRHIRD